MKVVPDLIIAGAPKCGSTSIFDWLSSHPEVCASSVKETYFLMDDAYPLVRKENNVHINGIEGYSNFFSHCSPNDKLLIEATPDYLYQETALDVLASLESPPNVLFILRKPSERVYSLYQFARNNVSSIPKNTGFREFIEAVMIYDDRSFLQGRRILQQSLRHSQYVEYLAQWIFRLNKHVHVVLFEDMRDSPKEFMVSLASQFGLDSAYFEDFDFMVRNKTYAIKQQSLHKLKRRLSSFLPLGAYRQLLRAIYAMLNTQATLSKSADDVEVLENLDRYFVGFNRELENLLGIDLSAWE